MTRKLQPGKLVVASHNQGKVKELRARYDALVAQAVAPKGGPAPKGFKSPKVWGEPD